MRVETGHAVRLSDCRAIYYITAKQITVSDGASQLVWQTCSLTGGPCCRLQALSAASTFAQGTRPETCAVFLHQQRGISSHNPAQPKLLVVHPKQKSPALLQEALRLAESYAGQCVCYLL